MIIPTGRILTALFFVRGSIVAFAHRDCFLFQAKD